MVKVVRYQSQQGITAQGSGVRMSGAALTVASGAAADFASTALSVGGEFLQRQKEADDNAWISRTTATAAKDWAEKLSQSKQQAPEGADGFAPQIEKDFQAYREQAIKDAPSTEAAALAGQRFDRLGVSLFDEALTFEAGAKRAKRGTDFELSINSLANAAFASPGQAAALIEQANGDLAAAANTWMLPQDASAQRKKISAQIAEAALRGRVQQDPQGVLAALDGEGDTTVNHLEPSQRATLASAARSELSRRDMERSVQRKGFETRLKNLSGVVEAGYNPGEQNFQALEADIAKFGDGALSSDVMALKATLGFQSEIRKWSPTMLQNWVNTEQARLGKGGVSASEAERMGLASKVLSSMRSGLAQDPLSWANAAGVAEVQPIEFSGSNAEASMHSRLNTALQLGEYYGVAPRFLTDEEEAQLKSTLEGASVDQQVALAFALNKGFGSEAPAVFQRLAGDDHLFAHAGGLASLGVAQAATARDVLAGRAALKAGNKVLPPATDMNDWTAGELGDAFSQTPRTRAAVIDAAKAIYATKALRLGLSSESPDEDLWTESVQLASGGVRDAKGKMRGGLGTWNDHAMVLPTGVTQNDFEKMLADAQDADLSSLGNPVHGDGAPLTADDLADARLVDYGHGQYLVDMSGTGMELVLGDGPGGYFVLDAAKLAKLQTARIHGVETAATQAVQP